VRRCLPLIVATLLTASAVSSRFDAVGIITRKDLAYEKSQRMLRTLRRAQSVAGRGASMRSVVRDGPPTPGAMPGTSYGAINRV
jgi:hypothetical protein